MGFCVSHDREALVLASIHIKAEHRLGNCSSQITLQITF